MGEPRTGRVYLTTRETHCGCCLRPVVLCEGAHTAGIFERAEGGRMEPHLCPDRAIEAWKLNETVKRLRSRNESRHRGGLN